MTDAKRTPIVLRILRQESPTAHAHWETFSLPYQPMMNVISCLMEIQKAPRTAEGKETTPPVWDCNCLEEVCGACTMIVNGTPRQACAALVDDLARPIELRPLTKFPLVKDLAVDRGRMFDSLRELRAWLPIDGTYDLGAGPAIGQDAQSRAYAYSRCMTCGCCMEACPNYNDGSPFHGPAPITQIWRFQLHPTGALTKGKALEAVMTEGGIADCGKAQNCVEVCPKEIPLTEGLAELGRETSIHWLKTLFRR